MARQYFVVVNEDGEEISREECVEKKGFFDTLKEKASGFSEKHPKIVKGLKIGGGIAAIGGAVAVGMAIADAGDDSDEYWIDSDDTTPLLETTDTESETTTDAVASEVTTEN